MARVESNVSIDSLRKILMLDQVDAGNGMLFGTATAGKAEPRTDTLTLVIGVGGSGAAAVAEAVKLADRRFIPEYRNFVDFLVIDSDKCEIEELFHGKWSVYKHLPVDIVILTSIGGGTESGNFMDLAAHAKQTCLMAGVAEVKIYGYIMLSDTTEHFATTGSTCYSGYQNVYAALKELESYMGIGFNRERKAVIESTDSTKNVTIDRINMLFDYPVLVSGDYKKAVSMIAETVVASVGRNSMSLNESLYGNFTQARQMALSQAEMCKNGVLKRDASLEDSYQYFGIGYAYAKIPEKIVISNVIGKVCRRSMNANTANGVAFCSRERRMTKLEFRDALNILFSGEDNQIPDEKVLWRRIDAKLWELSKLPENPNLLSYADVVENRTEEWETAFGAPEIVERGRKDIKECLTALYEDFIFRASRVMEKYGPRVMEYLYYGVGSDDPAEYADSSIQRIMYEVKGYLQETAIMSVAHPDPLPERGVLDRLAMFLKGVDVWKIAKEDAIQADIRREIARAMCGGNGIWIEEYQNKVEQFIQNCSHFADVLESMTIYYEHVGKSLDANDFTEFAQMRSESNEVNLCSDQKTYEWIKKRISQKVKSIDPNGIRWTVITDFIDHPELWCSCEEGVTRKHYDEIMSKACQLDENAMVNDMRLSVMWYVNEVLSSVPLSESNLGIEQEMEQRIDRMTERIMEELMQKSRPSLRIRNESICKVNKTVIIPGTYPGAYHGGSVFNRIQAYLGMHDVQVIVSSAVNSDVIVCYQTFVANVLSDLEDLPKWEAAYDHLPSNTKHLNCGEYVTQYKELSMTEQDELEHVVRQEKITPEDDLLGSTGLSWEHYPSVNLLAYQGKFTGFDEQLENSSEAQYRQNVFEKKIEYALKEKIIECEVVSPNVYRYWINLIPEDWDNLNVDNWMECEEGRCVRGWKLFDFLHSQNLHSSAAYRKQIVLNGSPVFESDFDFNTIIQLQYWGDARVEQEHRNYMKRIMRKNTALYMELEETLYRYYDIRKALEEKEKSACNCQK